MSHICDVGSIGVIYNEFTGSMSYQAPQNLKNYLWDILVSTYA